MTGYDVMKNTGHGSGMVYPFLKRLLENNIVTIEKFQKNGKDRTAFIITPEAEEIVVVVEA